MSATVRTTVDVVAQIDVTDRQLDANGFRLDRVTLIAGRTAHRYTFRGRRYLSNGTPGVRRTEGAIDGTLLPLDVRLELWAAADEALDAAARYAIRATR